MKIVEAKSLGAVYIYIYIYIVYLYKMEKQKYAKKVKIDQTKLIKK